MARDCRWSALVAAVLISCLCCASPSADEFDPYPVAPVDRLESYDPIHELPLFSEIVRSSQGILRRAYCSENPADPCCAGDGGQRCRENGFQPESVTTRIVHAKQHGCVVGEWRALDEAPASYAHGVFSKGAVYPALIRFSNSNARVRDDSVGDAQGMAIKLMGVSGPLLLPQDSSGDSLGSQDFLMINHPVFFVPNAEVYFPLQRALAAGGGFRLALFFLWHPGSLLLARELTSNPVPSPLQVRYHSMVPSLVGSRSEGEAVKFFADPTSCEGSVQDEFLAEGAGPDRLRDVMKARLDPERGQAACFDFFLVPRNSDEDSIEDATDEWVAAPRPPVRVAQLRIPVQEFDTPEKMAFCQFQKFSPWHGLAVHQPLGSLSRLRASVYLESANLRLRMNGVVGQQPRGATWEELLRHP